MFPSNNNGLSDYLVCYNNDQSIFHKPFLNDINSSSKQEDSPLSIFHLPSPFIQDELELEDHKLFLQQQFYDLLLQQKSLTNDDSTEPDIVNMADSSRVEVDALTKDCNKSNKIVCNRQIPSKIPSKKDRHSKINTAKGPRDRRMRLSLDVARKFFDLQDMLGYDKASKTVEWLLIQAKSEIKNLEIRLPKMNYCFSVGGNIASSTSECDVVPGIDKADIPASISSKGKPSVKEKKIRNTRKTIHRPHARDLRDKARARARERTSKKMWSRRFDESKAKDFNQLGSLSSSEAGKDFGNQSHNRNYSLKVLAEIEEQRSNDWPKLRNQEEILDDAFVIMGKLSQPSNFNYLQNIGTSQEHQFGDFQFFDKPSEACNY